MTSPVLRREHFPDPVTIASIELLTDGEVSFVRARSTGGVEGLVMTNRRLIFDVAETMRRRFVPIFEGRDARDLDALIEETFIGGSRYKRQGTTFWTGVAWIEFAILDMLGQVAGKPIGELIGARTTSETDIYYASGNRGNTPEAEADYLAGLVDESGARAVKFRLGGRMFYDEVTTRRDEALIELARARFGPDMVLMADANGSYDVPMSLHIAGQMAELNYEFFEEPVRFDDFDGTKRVKDAASLPIAGGEQESSLFRYRWLMENAALDVIQPDVLLNGGYVRAVRVARMAAAAGLPVVPHIAGWGLGVLHVLHYASCTPNIGQYIEYKGYRDGVPYELTREGGRLDARDGRVIIPGGPGLGLRFDPAYLARLRLAWT